MCVGTYSAITKLRKAIYLTHACLPVCPPKSNTTAFIGRNFMEIHIGGYFFRNSPAKLNCLWNQTRISGTLHEQLCQFLAARRFLVTIRNVSDKNCREHQKDALGLINFSWKSFRLWDNVKKMYSQTDYSVICPLCNSEYVIHIAFPRQKWKSQLATI
jgi:hypothetical protein